MSKKNIYLTIIMCVLLGVRCSEKLSIDNQYQSYIDIDLSSRNYEENYKLFVEASKRFNEYVYKNEHGVYCTSINKGSDIKISEKLFNVLTEALPYRDKIRMLRSSLNNQVNERPFTRAHPQEVNYDYDSWVFTNVRNLLTNFGAWVQAGFEDAVVLIAHILAISVFAILEFIQPVFIFTPPGAFDNYQNDPFYEYYPYPLVAPFFQTNLPNGIYPGNSGDRVHVRNGIAMPRQGYFSWFRENMRFVEDYDLIAI